MTSSEPSIVLVAEDPFIGKFLRALLERHGYRVETAPAPRALEILCAGELHPDLVITNTPADFLPVADHIALLYTAAMPDTDLASSFPHCRTLTKPFRNEELLQAVAALTPAM
jgi:CheY-like chemotaxis protein